MYIQWERGNTTLNFLKEQTPHSVSSDANLHESHGAHKYYENKGTVLMQLLRADKLVIAEKFVLILPRRCFNLFSFLFLGTYKNLV